MAAFSASDLAFEGFRITRERPLWVLTWAGLLAVVQIVTLLIVAGMAGGAMAELQAASDGQPDPARMMAAYSRLAPAYSIIWPLSIVVSAMLACGVYRASLRPNESSVMGLRLGGDELRVGIVYIAVSLLIGVVVFVGFMAATLVGVGVGAAAGEGAGLTVGLLLGLVAFGVLIWMAVRLSLATPMTFEQKDFRVFESWRATQGLFWPLLGAFILALILGVLVTLLLSVVFLGVGAVALIGSGQSLQGSLAGFSDPSQMMQAATPVAMVYAVFNAAIGTLFNVILLAPAAAAWRQISGPEKAFA